MQPRHDNEAEQSVIGAVLMDQRVLDDLVLDAEDFYRPQHEDLWRLIQSEARSGRPVTTLSLSHRIHTDPIAGIDATYLHKCTEFITSAYVAEHYAKIVKGLARLRRMADVATQLLQASQAASWDNTEQPLDEARALLDRTANEASGVKIRTFNAALRDAIETWTAPKGRGFGTGWRELDQKFNGGWYPGQLTVLGARPAIGKSLVAGCAAVAASSYGAGFFSLEMKEHEVVARMTAASEGIDLHTINTGNFSESDWSKLTRLNEKSAEWPVYVEEKSMVTMAQIRATVRSWKRRGPVPLVIVDYLQLVSPADRRESRERQVSRIAEDCKHLAKEFDTHVLALAQVNRESTSRDNKRPTMADLRESGGIEAHADNIILLHRDDKEMEGEIEFIVEKNRHGETGKIRLAWRPHFASVNSMIHNEGDFPHGIG